MTCNLFSQQITLFVAGKLAEDKIIAAVLNEKTRQLINAKSTEVLFSKHTFNKQLAHHPEINTEDYQLIPEIIESGEIYHQKEKTYVLLRHNNGTLYRLALKTTQAGDEIYFLSLFKTTQELADMQIRNKFKRIR